LSLCECTAKQFKSVLHNFVTIV